MIAQSKNEAMCLVHFLETIETIPVPVVSKQTVESTETIDETRPSRRQPPRRAKKPTNFFDVENPVSLKRVRISDEEDSDEDHRPCKRRREGLVLTDGDVILDEIDRHGRSAEIIRAAKRIVRRGHVPDCCFADHPMTCSACELKLYQPLPQHFATAEPAHRRKTQIKLVGRLADKNRINSVTSPASDIRKKRIKLVGRLAPVADMKPCKVTEATPPAWNPRKGARPFMKVRYHDHDFAVDFCKDLIFMPMRPRRLVES